MTKSKKDTGSSDKDILSIARERFKLAEEANIEIRKESLDDLEFRVGNQWHPEDKRDRDADRRPCLVINRIPQFIRQITNDQRQNRPSIKVSPVDDVADVDTAKIFQGLIRHIEYNSNADVAYDTSFDGAVTKGFGYFRIITDYVDPMSFEQEILIKRILDHFSVHMDPHAKEPDGSDSNWATIFEDVSSDDFKADYPEANLSKMEDWASLGNQVPGWVNEKSCRVAEYFYKELKQVTLVQLNTGASVDKSKLPETLPEGVEIVKERKTTIPLIKWCKHNGYEILEETDWPGQWIPIIPVYGDEIYVNGKRILEGVIRHAKDPQRMYNYWASTETETIALAPKAPFIVAEGQIPKEYEMQWKTANRKTHAYLTYKQTDHKGQPAPPPQRNVYEAPVQAITNARMQSSEDLKATTGIYDATLGNRSNEQSGVAIQRRNIQSQTSNFHFIDNLTRSLRHAGRILIDLIPKIYDTPRSARILGDDGQQEIVRLNEIFNQDGETKFYDLSVGKYDITVETGPSYATKRQEALASMLELTGKYPKVAEVAADLMVKSMDWPGAQEIAERLKKTMPPGIVDDKNQPLPLPPEAQQKMQQYEHMIDQLTHNLHAANEKINTKSLELESKERVEFAKIEATLTIEQLRLQGQAAMETLKAEMHDVHRRLELLRSNQPFDQDFNGPGPDQAAVQNTQQQQQQQQPTGGFSPG